MPDDVRNDFISYKIGDDRPLAWPLLEVDGDDLAAGRFTAKAQVRARPGGPVLHEWSTSNGRARFSSVPGPEPDDPARWFLELLVDDSRSWSWERGAYDVFITDPGDADQPIAEGQWVNRAAITDV